MAALLVPFDERQINPKNNTLRLVKLALLGLTVESVLAMFAVWRQ